QRAWKKFMGLREPFTILRNVRDRTSPIAPSVDLVRFPSWRIACIKRNTACSGYRQKTRARLETSVKRRIFGNHRPCTDGVSDDAQVTARADGGRPPRGAKLGLGCAGRL